MTHNNPHYADRTAVAPYNFVPLPGSVLPVDAPGPQDVYAGYSGQFDVELETSSPTFIRGMVTEAEFQSAQQAKDKPGFFSLDGRAPLIPGSSLRGLFRTLAEVLSFSKLSQVTDQRQVFRAVDTTSHGAAYRERLMQETQKNYFVPRVRAGYMRWHQGDWYIQPAQEMGGTTFARIYINDIPAALGSWHGSRNAQQIYIQPGPYEFQQVRGDFLHIKYSKVMRVSAEPGPGLQAAVLAPSGPMQSKRREAVIFAPDEAGHGQPQDWLKVDPDTVRIYRDTLSDEQRRLLGDQGVLRDYQPVFCLVEGDRVFFGHTLMMRLPYTKAPADLLVDEDRSAWDMTEALFGRVAPDDKAQAVAGRVFFSDARWVAHAGSPFEREITPKVLSGPKPTTFQHYLEQPNPDDRLRLHNYDAKGARLRGHKFYWQKGDVKVEQVEETDARKLRHASQYTRIQPLKSGEKFTFRLRFDNLTAQELGLLAWLLQLGADPAYRFKLGMGKPLGMGAVKVSATLTLIDREARYTGLWQGPAADWQAGELPAEQAEQARQTALQAFEAWVLAANRPAKTLLEVGRLQHWLKLLAWLERPTDPELTRYMEIERVDPQARRGKRNEYRERPVLPDPLNVGVPAKSDKAPAPRPLEKSAPFERAAAAPARPVAPPPPKPKPAEPRIVERSTAQTALTDQIAAYMAAQPLSALPAPGALLRATVSFADDDQKETWCDVEVDEAGALAGQTVLAVVKWGPSAPTYAEGAQVALRFVRVRREAGGELEVEAELAASG